MMMHRQFSLHLRGGEIYDGCTSAVPIVFLPIRRMSQNFLSAICSTFFHSMTAITSVPPYCQALFLVPAKRSVLMPRICAISISINLSGCASTFFPPSAMGDAFHRSINIRCMELWLTSNCRFNPGGARWP